jgi:hypothetical protein
MFFRCGDLIVEVVRRPVAGADQAHDKLWGLSWRVADIDATHARLVAAGIDVSQVRIGRKPGTRVLSVRNGTCGIHTLLLERTARASTRCFLPSRGGYEYCALHSQFASCVLHPTPLLIERPIWPKQSEL